MLKIDWKKTFVAKYAISRPFAYTIANKEAKEIIATSEGLRPTMEQMTRTGFNSSTASAMTTMHATRRNRTFRALVLNDDMALFAVQPKWPSFLPGGNALDKPRSLKIGAKLHVYCLKQLKLPCSLQSMSNFLSLSVLREENAIDKFPKQKLPTTANCIISYGD